jgi:plastocyanin
MEENTATPKSSNNLIIILVVVVLVVIGGYMLTRGKGATITTEPTTTNTTGTEMAVSETSQAITVEASEFAFTPVSTWQVGQPVTLTLTNVGKMPHDFVIDEISGARTEIIQPGQTTTVEFTPTQAGTFTYYCSVGSHRAQGMEGTVVVQ